MQGRCLGNHTKNKKKGKREAGAEIQEAAHSERDRFLSDIFQHKKFNHLQSKTKPPVSS